MKKAFLGMMVLVFALTAFSPAWALDGKQLTDRMFKWANIWGLVFTAYQQAENPHFPVNWDLLEKKVEEMEQIQRDVAKQIGEIATLEEISQTRNVLYYFKALTVFERNVRENVSKLVDDRERFLKNQS